MIDRRLINLTNVCIEANHVLTELTLTESSLLLSLEIPPVSCYEQGRGGSSLAPVISVMGS